MDTALAFTCPRCGVEVTERFFGPCGSCRSELLAVYGTADQARAADPGSGRFEPKLHVVPNHVATKE